ncbi:MAG TPA: glycosyltransferase family 2 protein [Chitinivibrionales bacterium]|jgi:glycosyltransferase involved in cell wall biosynthesis|nr:glycosyltransferase family 2 protein [Chitinivibrionales bacterium]
MILGKKVVVVLPAYNAEKTLRSTYDEIPRNIVDEVVLVDDASRDNTVALAKTIGIGHVIAHDKNKGYGANQKTCYAKALEICADIVVMLHPDYQYTPRLIPAMVNIIASGLYPVVLGSRILGKGARSGGMPTYKYISNRFLTLAQNMLMGQKLSEYHTGYRAFSREVLESVNWKDNSDDFVFDNQMLAQICYAGFPIAEVTCPTKYFKEASSINFARSVKYGLGVLGVAIGYRMEKWGLGKRKMFRKDVDQ